LPIYARCGLERRAPHKTGDARARWNWRSSLPGDPGSKFICGKLENTGRKKKEHTRKKRDGIRTAELNRRDQVTAPVPGPVSFERGKQRSISRQQHLLNWERPPCTERQSLSRDRGGPARMQGIYRKERENRTRKTLLTHTGLLMEGA